MKRKGQKPTSQADAIAQGFYISSVKTKCPLSYGEHGGARAERHPLPKESNFNPTKQTAIRQKKKQQQASNDPLLNPQVRLSQRHLFPRPAREPALACGVPAGRLPGAQPSTALPPASASPGPRQPSLPPPQAASPRLPASPGYLPRPRCQGQGGSHVPSPAPPPVGSQPHLLGSLPPLITAVALLAAVALLGCLLVHPSERVCRRRAVP